VNIYFTFCAVRKKYNLLTYLLEPDTCAATKGISKIKTVVYGEIVKMKQDRIIPVFHCQVFETIASQYCGHWSSASDKSVKRYIHFREPKPTKGMGMQASTSPWKVVLSRRNIQANIGATMLHDIS
jgi:hypothetical protein